MPYYSICRIFEQSKALSLTISKDSPVGWAPKIRQEHPSAILRGPPVGVEAVNAAIFACGLQSPQIDPAK